MLSQFDLVLLLPSCTFTTLPPLYRQQPEFCPILSSAHLSNILRKHRRATSDSIPTRADRGIHLPETVPLRTLLSRPCYRGTRGGHHPPSTRKDPRLPIVVGRRRLLPFDTHLRLPNRLLIPYLAPFSNLAGVSTRPLSGCAYPLDSDTSGFGCSTSSIPWPTRSSLGPIGSPFHDHRSGSRD